MESQIIKTYRVWTGEGMIVFTINDLINERVKLPSCSSEEMRAIAISIDGELIFEKDIVEGTVMNVLGNRFKVRGVIVYCHNNGGYGVLSLNLNDPNKSYPLLSHQLKVVSNIYEFKNSGDMLWQRSKETTGVNDSKCLSKHSIKRIRVTIKISKKRISRLCKKLKKILLDGISALLRTMKSH